MASSIETVELIAIWEILHEKDTGDIGFYDLYDAFEAMGIEVRNNDVGCSQSKDSPHG